MRSQTERDYRERVLRVLIHIQNRLDEVLALDELAALAHFSPYHFHRIFRGMVGESVMEHVRRLRLERAAHRLKFSDLPVTHVAFEAGYETHEAFTRAFGAMFGEPPSQFRAAQRAMPYPPVPSGVHYTPDGQLGDFHPHHFGGLPMDVRIETVPTMRVAFVRHTGPYCEDGQAWQRLMAWAGPRGLFGPHTRMLGVCHDDPDVTPADKIRYDACVTVDGRAQPEGDVGVQEVGGGEYAVTTHHGSYDTLSQTYARLCGEWLTSSGRETRPAPPFEVYRNSPQTTAPADLLTDIYLPLAAP